MEVCFEVVLRMNWQTAKRVEAVLGLQPFKGGNVGGLDVGITHETLEVLFVEAGNALSVHFVGVAPHTGGSERRCRRDCDASPRVEKYE